MIKNETLEGNAKFEGYSLDLIDEISKLTGLYTLLTITKKT